VGAGRPSATGPVQVTPPAPEQGPNPVPVTGPIRTGPSVPTSAPSAPSTPSTPSAGQSAGPASWTAIVVADRDYYESVVRQNEENKAFTFPPYCPERRVPLDRPQIRIGRRSVSQGIVPEIDLSEAPEDPGASHTHAVLLAKPDGTWTLVDPGSTNGTTVNANAEPIPVNIEVPMRDGDRVHVGVWTTITLRKG
jgi:hypothetical protein